MALYKLIDPKIWYDWACTVAKRAEIETFCKDVICLVHADDMAEINEAQRQRLQNVGVKRLRMGESQLIDNDHMAPGVVLDYDPLYNPSSFESLLGKALEPVTSKGRF